jgi:hypothetical protein
METRDLKKWDMKKEGRDRQGERHRNAAMNGKLVEV